MVDMGDVLNKIVFLHTVKGVRYTMHCSSVVHSKRSLSSCLWYISGDT